jgi:hypothetical protein
MYSRSAARLLGVAVLRGVGAFVLLVVALMAVAEAEPVQRSFVPPPRPIEQPPPRAAETQPTPQTPPVDPRGTEQVPLIVKVLERPQSETEAAQEIADREQQRARDGLLAKFTDDLALYTEFLAALSALQLAAFLYQGYWLRRTFKSAEDTASRQLRAYVGVREFEIEDFVVGEVPIVRFEIANSGQTPSYRTRIWVGVGYLPNPMEGTFPEPNHGTTFRVLNPADSITRNTRAEGILTQDILDAINAKTTRLWVVGQVEYRDAFGRDHRTDFRSHYDPRNVALAISEDGNDAN